MEILVVSHLSEKPVKLWKKQEFFHLEGDISFSKNKLFRFTGIYFQSCRNLFLNQEVYKMESKGVTNNFTNQKKYLIK